jgi:hypothetical protein
LTAGAIAKHGRGAVIVDRQKTGEAAGGILSARTLALVEAYRAGLGYELLDNAPLLRTRGLEKTTAKGGRPRPGAPYTKNSLAEEFREIRVMRFGADEKRKLLDLRRSGAVEAIVGGATAELVAHGMGNTLGASNALFETYVPRNVTSLEQVAEARRQGRKKARAS